MISLYSARLKAVKLPRPPPFTIKILHLGVTLNVWLAINDHPQDMQPTHSHFFDMVNVVNALQLQNSANASGSVIYKDVF